MITGKNYLGNRMSGEGSKTYRTFNPEKNQNNEELFYEATQKEISIAIELAADAFRTYKSTSDKSKAKFIDAIAAEIEGIEDAIIDTYVRETGLPRGRAKGECARTVGQLRSFARMLEEGSWVEAIISNPEGKPDIRRMQIPIGPVVVFGASNFPLAYSTAGGDTASALAAGCPVVVKSHPMHAGTGELVSSAILKAAEKTGMPNGVFSNINSSGIEVGKLMVEHPKVKAVGFTGSLKGGDAIRKIASERTEPIPVYAEMGSINPVVVLPKALQQKGEFWAEQYASSITLGAGQFCTNPGLILGIEGEELDDFIFKLAENLQSIEPTCMLHSDIKKKFEEVRDELLAQGKLEKVIKAEKETKENYAQAQVITVKGKNFKSNPNFRKEVFGPFSVIVKCKNKTELLSIVESLDGQLTGTVLCEGASELEEFTAVAQALQNSVGRIILNNVPTGVEVCAAMTHGGPYPASSDSKFTSVGITAVKRWVRPISFQNWPNSQLPAALQNDNPLGILRNVNNVLIKDTI